MSRGRRTFILLPVLFVIFSLGSEPGASAWSADKDYTTEPLTLAAALQLAWKENAQLKVSRLEELIAGEEVVKARAGFLPKINAQTSHTIFDNPVKYQIFAGQTFAMSDRNFWSNQLVAEQTIYDFGATGARYQRAKLGTEVAKWETGASRDEIFLQVAQLYFQVLKSEKLVTVAEQEVAQLQEHLKIAQDLYQFGLVNYNDVLQAQVALADARQRLISARNQVVQSRSTLNKFLGLPIAAPTKLKDETSLALPQWDLATATTEALDNRSDLKAMERRVRQGEKAITEARAHYLPRFFVQAGQTYQQNDRSVHDTQYFAILGLQWNLFAGLETRAAVAQARERLAQLQIQHRDLAEQAKLEVQNAYLSLKESAERIAVTRDAIAQGEENLRLNEERYKEQVGTATDVIDAQTLLTKARVNYYTALYDHQINKARLLRAVGRINQLVEADPLRPNPARDHDTPESR